LQLLINIENAKALGTDPKPDQACIDGAQAFLADPANGGINGKITSIGSGWTTCLTITMKEPQVLVIAAVTNILFVQKIKPGLKTGSGFLFCPNLKQDIALYIGCLTAICFA
jgi:hypothetical protein